MSDLITVMAGAAGAGGAETDEYFNQTTLLLHGDGTNGAQNNTFLDSSTNNFTITRNGNTTQGTFSPFSVAEGQWSNNFSSTSTARLTTPSSSEFAFGTGDFTMEAFVYATQSQTDNWIIGLANNCWLRVGSGGVLEFYNQVTTTGTLGSTVVPINQWNHVAAVRIGTTLTLYLNGVSDGTATVSTNFSTNVACTIGNQDGADRRWYGYINSARVVKGTGVYTGAFTPPTAPLTAISGTSILTCQSNRFVDNSSNAFALTVTSTPSVQPFSPFAPSAAYYPSVNGGSGYFDGSGDYLTTPTDADFAFGTGDFTVECWCYLTSTSSYRYLFDFREGSGATSNIYAYFDTGTTTVRIGVGATDDSSSGSVSLNTWSHIALVRSGTTVTVYINGSSTNSFTSSQDLSTSTAVFIGSRYTNQQYMIGYVASFRAVKGTAVYTSAFTPPTAPLTAIANTSLLLNFTNAGIFDNTGKNNLETVADCAINTTTKKYGTGSMEFDGTGDYLAISNNESFGFTGDFTCEAWIYPTIVSGLQNIFSTENIDFKLSGNVIRIYTTTGSNSTGTINANEWTFVTLCRSGSTFYVSINGTVETVTPANFTSDGSSAAEVGRRINGANELFNGYIDDLRITKGVARYTANFTPPTKAFPNL